jgi:hypothetical protein
MTLTDSSGWIEDSQINPYNEHKEQMIKAGKTKGTFNKAVKEIEDFMNDPNVSGTSIGFRSKLINLSLSSGK